MFHVLLVLVLVAAATAARINPEDYNTPVITAKLLDEIAAKATTWKAGAPRFANTTVADAKRMMGTVLSHEEGYIAPEVIKTTFKYSEDDIPESFDVRDAWPNCANVVGRVRDQSNCGSCWAMSSTESFNDRWCITTGDNKTVFSTEDTASCCRGRECNFSMGCNGGQPAGAWSWFTEHGVSTGGDWSEKGTCKPYSMQTCAHHVEPSNGLVACDTLPEYKTPECKSTCTDSTYVGDYATDKATYVAKSSYSIIGEKNIQRELLEHGTISVAISVYEDFEAYTSGVYQHVSGSYLGGHAIKLIGWGVEKGTPYWLCVNSWNDTWGEKGTFKILRGSNECGIEKDGVAGLVK